jgi:2-methylcitrate dehydratase PrpD
MALLDGTITPAMMASGRYRDADVLALMRKCSIELPDEFDRVAPAIRCCRLTATLDVGRSVVVEYRRSMADDAADPGWSQAVEKFEQLTAGLLVASARNRLIALVDVLERQETIAPLMALTRLGHEAGGS